MKTLFKISALIGLSFALGVGTTLYLTERVASEQAKALFHEALRYYEKGDHDLAAALLNRSIAKNSREYAPFYLLGEIYVKKGNLKLALQMYTTSLQKLKEKSISETNADRVSLEEKIEKKPGSDHSFR